MTLADSSNHQLRAFAAFGRTVLADRAIPFSRSNETSTDKTSGTVIELSENQQICSQGPPDTAKLIHQAADMRDGPRLRVLREGAHLWVDYVGFIFRMSPASRTIAYCELQTTRQAVGFEGLIERVVLPLYFLFEAPEVVGVHGGSVAIGDEAWIFIGDSGAGKSTTARVLVERGAGLIADDMTLIDQANGCVLPGCPAVRLWEAKGAVELAVEDRPESVFRDKRWFRFPAACAALSPVAMGGIFILSPQAHDAALSAPAFERAGGSQAFAALMAQTFDISSPEPDWTRQRFETVAKLARTIPIYRYTFARSQTGEPTHVDALEEFIATSKREHDP
jgi:hypothetical protein